MYWDKSDLLFLPVGGSEEIGMNANLYHYNDKWILVDLGISFPDETQLGVDILLPDFVLYLLLTSDKLPATNANKYDGFGKGSSHTA